MLTSFLDLPREIRDQIYAHVFLSPTGFVELQPTSSSARFTLLINSHNPFHIRECCTTDEDQPQTQNKKQKTEKEKPPLTLSLSLPRTCRQIHAETQRLFYMNNTIYFHTFEYRSASHPGLIKTLKTMGQAASRLITSICINMGPSLIHPSSTSSLGKVLQFLASRARHGSFKRLELVWSEFAFLTMKDLMVGGGRNRKQWMSFEGLCFELRKDSENCRYQRVITLPASTAKVSLLEDRQLEDAVAAELHFSFGGRLFCGETLVWDELRKVGELDFEMSALGV